MDHSLPFHNNNNNNNNFYNNDVSESSFSPDTTRRGQHVGSCPASAKPKASTTFARLMEPLKAITLRRLVHGLPAVLVGAMLNLLDIVSTGMLIFPSGANSGFAQVLQLGMAIYTISLFTSQLAVTCGGSSYRGALGSMLVEVIPLLREIAIDIRDVVGAASPALVPTTLVAWAMCSLLMGLIFLGLGLFRAGWLLSYFPRAVLHGVVGGVGVHLFVMGFELMQPAASPHMAWNELGGDLFSPRQLPLTLVTVLPALLLTLVLRYDLIANLAPNGEKLQRLFLPIFMIAAAVFFWVGIAASGQTNTDSLEELVEEGWLFDTKSMMYGGSSAEASSGFGGHISIDAINYWRLFQFERIQWTALGAAAQNIVLVVVIGVINLPVALGYLESAVPDVKVNVDRELFGSAAGNILAGMLGSLPNLIVFSYTRMFTDAGGDRLHGVLVSCTTLVVLFVAPAIIPFVPTLLASSLVAYIGIDLLLHGGWDSAKKVPWPEYLVVLGTLVASCAMGFAIGVAIGIGMAVCLWLIHWVMYRLATEEVGLEPTPAVLLRQVVDKLKKKPEVTEVRVQVLGPKQARTGTGSSIFTV